MIYGQTGNRSVPTAELIHIISGVMSGVISVCECV